MSDLISRQDAIEAVKETLSGNVYWDYVCDAVKALSALPSADADCSTCKHNDKGWDSEECDSCCGNNNHYESAKAKGDLISRQDAVTTIKRYKHRLQGKGQTYGFLLEEFEHQIPSAEATVGDFPNDLISRSALMEYCSNQKSKSIDNNDIARFPSAEAVQGEWIDIDNYYRMATCSRCHKVTMFEKWGEYTQPYNYCPNCGARMKGGEDE